MALFRRGNSVKRSVTDGESLRRKVENFGLRGYPLARAESETYKTLSCQRRQTKGIIHTQ